MTTSPIGSVVIPAHNEAAVIGRCLDALLADLAPGELDVVVSCNGCTDDTANIVRTSWPTVRVIETSQASKPAALRAADEILSVFPRIYLDADIILSGASARIIIEHLQTGSALGVRPSVSYDLSNADLLVRRYYQAAARVYSRTTSLWGGCGAYGLSAVGRGRFEAFPDLIADDLFVAKWFEPSEVETVNSAHAVVTVPRRTTVLFQVLRRRHQGNVDIRNLPDGPRSTVLATVRSLVVAAMSGPNAAVDTVIFMGIAAAVRITRAISPPAGWTRDVSSREGAMTPK